MRVVPLLGLLALTSLCADAGGDPAECYAAFVDHAAQGDATAAWQLLSSATRDQLTRRAREIAEFRHQPAPKDGRELAFGEPFLSRPKLDRVSVTGQSQNSATVEATDEKGGRQTVHLVREDGQWKVDLTHELDTADGK